MLHKIKNRKQYKEIQALNYSGAKEILKSPAHYKAFLEKSGDSDSKALRMGSLTHAMVLQPEIVDLEFAVSPDCDRRTKEGKALYESFLSTSEGKTVLSGEEFGVCRNTSMSMFDALAANNVEFEHTELMLSCEYNGITLKCAIDAVGKDGYLYDLKTTEDASMREFKNSIFNYRYHLQAHFYMTIYHIAFGVKPKGFRFIAAEKKEPWAHAVYECGPVLQALGEEQFETAVTVYRACLTLGEWPSYGSDPQIIDIK